MTKALRGLFCYMASEYWQKQGKAQCDLRRSAAAVNFASITCALRLSEKAMCKFRSDCSSQNDIRLPVWPEIFTLLWRVLFTTMAGYCYVVIWFLAHMEKRKKKHAVAIRNANNGKRSQQIKLMHIQHATRGIPIPRRPARAPWETYRGRILFYSLMEHLIFTQAKTHLILHGHSSLMNGVFVSPIFHLCASNFYDSINSTPRWLYRKLAIMGAKIMCKSFVSAKEDEVLTMLISWCCCECRILCYWCAIMIKI